MKHHTRPGMYAPKRTLLVVAVSAALFGSFGAAADEKNLAKGTTGTKSNEHMHERPTYSDEQWTSIARSSLAVRVQSNLANSASLRGADITVSAGEDGNVTLKGTVSDEFQEQRALRIAQRTAGVSDVDDQLAVNGSLAEFTFEPMNDEKLARRVARAIAQEFDGAKVEESWFFGYQVQGRSDTGRDWTIEVDADEGEIALDGELPRNADVQKALRATRRITAVRSITNDVHSHELRDLSYAPLRYRYYAPGYMYSGTLVTAEGTVQSGLVCQLASYRGVGNQRVVTKAKQTDTSSPSKAAAHSTGHPTFTDEEWRSIFRSSLATRVLSNLVNSASLVGSDISVRSDGDGEVTVSGKVASEEQKERALRIAERTAGVTSVDDEIDVNGGHVSRLFEPTDDEQLAKRVAQAIAQELGGAKVDESWFFGYHVSGRTQTQEKWKIEVDADEGEITLNGELPRNEDVQKALQAARRVPAVRNIDNDLQSNEQRYLIYAPQRYRYHPPGYMHPGPLVTAVEPVSGDLVCQIARYEGDGTGGPVTKVKSN